MDFEHKIGGGRTPLEQRPVPQPVAEQIKRFDYSSIEARPTASFRPRLEEGATAIGIDIADDCLSVGEFVVSGSELILGRMLLQDANNFKGANYLDDLRGVARYAQSEDIPVGISFAGPLEGNKPGHGENIDLFMEHLQTHYKGDFGRLFRTLSAVENDAIAGLWAASLNAEQQHRAQNVVYLINDGGLNASVKYYDMLLSMEAGHVELAPQLNPHDQQKPCWLHRGQVCIEAVAASRVGIEDLLIKNKRRRLTDEELEAHYTQGDDLATELYDNSANVCAHMVQGIAQTMGIDLNAPETAIVCHGKAFRFPGYGARLQQIIEAHTGQPINLYHTKDFSDNASLGGAALAALSK